MILGRETATLGYVQAAISQIISLAAFCLVVAGVLKVFQISTDMGEIKDLLKDIKRNTSDYSPERLKAQVPPPSAGLPQSPEDLARAVRSASYEDELRKALEPEVIPPGSTRLS
jgi:hypothetical protein